MFYLRGVFQRLPGVVRNVGFRYRVHRRMANPGLEQELMESPSLWQGHRVIQKLQKSAMETAMMDPWFPGRMKKVHYFLLDRFVQEVDTIFGFTIKGH